jgi:hypothetical protein
MSIARFGGTTSVSVSAGTSQSITLPASIPANALIIVGTVNSLTSTFSTPTGFTSLGDAIQDPTTPGDPVGSTGVGFDVWYKVAAGTEGGTSVSTTASHAGFWCMSAEVFTGTSTGSLADIFADHEAVIEDNAGDTTITTASLTNDDARSWGVFLFSYRSSSTGGFTSYSGSSILASGVTERADVSSSGTTKVFLSVSDTATTVLTGSGALTGTSASAPSKVAWGAFIRVPRLSSSGGHSSVTEVANAPQASVGAKAQVIG